MARIKPSVGRAARANQKNSHDDTEGSDFAAPTPGPAGSGMNNPQSGMRKASKIKQGHSGWQGFGKTPPKGQSKRGK